MPKSKGLLAHVRNHLRGFQAMPYSPLMWLFRDVLGVSTIALGRYCDTSQSQASLAISRACKTRSSKKYRYHLDNAVFEVDKLIRERLKMLRTEEESSDIDPDRLPPEVYNATVDYLEALRAYVKAIGEWRDR